MLQNSRFLMLSAIVGPHLRAQMSLTSLCCLLLSTSPRALMAAQPVPVEGGSQGRATDSRPSNASSIDAHLARLKDKDPAVVAQALRNLGAQGEMRAFRPIIDLLSRTVAMEVRGAGLSALEKLEYTPAFLIEVLQDPAQPALAQSYAAYTLGRMRSSEAVPALIAALQSKDDQVRERAIDALGRIKDPRAWKPLILMANKDSSPALRTKAQKTVESLGSLGSARVDSEALALQLKDPSPGKRREAAQALSQYGDWWSIRPLGDALQDPDQEVRRYAARALGDLQDKRAVGPLVSALPRSSGLARQTALIALGVLKDDTAVEPLLRYLKDPDADTRKLTARALANLGSARSGPALAEALSDLVPENRREVARALGLVKDPRAVSRLMVVVRDDVEENQIEATRAIGRIGGSEAVSQLIRILDDRNPMLAVTAVIGLREAAAMEAVPALEQVARQHKDAYVREEALTVAVELRGKSNRPSDQATP